MNFERLLPKTSMIFLETEGSTYERGKIHGEALKKHILRMMFKEITRHFGFTSYDLFAKDILDKTNFLSTAKKWADGAKFDFNSIFIRQLIGEMGWYWTKFKKARNLCLLKRRKR